jgi:prepilin-type N-terminal cleavage/methylation domain-containing protein
MAEPAQVKGFTLIEVIIVMAILSIVMMAVMSLILPMQRSAAVQSQVVDVQGNLRVALEGIAKDFRNAGFLCANPIVFNGAEPNKIVINTRAGRVGIVNPAGIPAAPTGDFTLSDVEQGNTFPPGTFVGIFSPLAPDNYLNGQTYRVDTQNAGDKRLITLIKSGGSPLLDADIDAFRDVSQPLVLLPIASAAVPVANTIRTITYEFDAANKALKRSVDGGATQYLARGVVGSFEPKNTTMADGSTPINRVIVNLTGETKQVGVDDAIGSVKTKTIRTVFTLRNI